jgi:hypothetical protein
MALARKSKQMDAVKIRQRTGAFWGMAWLLAVLACAIGVAQVREQPMSRSFCELVRDPAMYDGKLVKVRATYRYGFEWQELYCLGCLDRGKAWSEFAHELDRGSRRALRRAPKYAGVVNVTVTGVFKGEGHFGHLNGYRYMVVMSKIEDLRIVSKGIRREEAALEERYGCGGTDPR